MNKIIINDRTITDDSPAYIIAEMSASHAGSLENALKIIHTAKESGADCIKIQTYTSDTLTLNSDNPDFIHRGGLWDGYTYYQLYKEASTPWEWQEQLKREAENIGLDFFSTPFDFSAVDFLEKLGVSFYKIASFELIDIPLIEYIASKGKPVIMSTGMASPEEIDEAVSAIRAQGNNQIALLKCSSLYPADPQDMNLITIPYLKERYGVVAGLSDHSFGSFSSIIGVSLGARIIEKHLCLDRKIKNNPDAEFSMEPPEFKRFVEDIRAAEKAIGQKPFIYTDAEIHARIHRRSLYVSADIKKGEAFSMNNIKSVRPGHGLAPRYLNQVLGKCAAADLSFGTALTLDMVEHS